MSLPNELLPVGLLGTGAAGGYQIERSLRFNSSDSAYLSRTPASAGNRRTWTWAGWVKRSKSGEAIIFYRYPTTGTGAGLAFSASDTLGLTEFASSVTTYGIGSTAVFRDFSAWYHIVAVVDSSNATSTERARLYVNGERITSFGTATYPSLNYEGLVNQAALHTIGRREYAPSYAYFNGYLADVHFIDGQALDPTSFGEFDENGIWQPVEYTGEYGTNGFHLPFSDNSSASALGTDTSGNGNDWTVNNLSVTPGAGNDSVIDVPTNGTQTDTGLGGEVRGNYCTLNPLYQNTNSSTVSEGNLYGRTTATSGYFRIGGTIFVSSGKWYWEYTPTELGIMVSGVATNRDMLSSSIGSAGVYKWLYYSFSGTKFGPGIYNVSYGASYAINDVIGVALDMDAGTITFYKNGVSQGTAFTDLAGYEVTPVMDLSGFGGGTNTGAVFFNFGQRPFAYQAPSGFKALNTANLPTPTILDGSEYMDVVTYTGNGSTQTISGLEFSPDFVWIKSRSAAYFHRLYDTIRGTDKALYSNSTDAEAAYQSVNENLTAFNSDGFSLGSTTGTNGINQSGETFVTWAWDAGSSTVENTDGTITSQVRANPSAGFSIVSWTGTGANGTVAHGLNAVPELIIVKLRNNTVGHDWTVYSKPTGNTNLLKLNTTDAVSSTSLAWNNTTPTSSVFTVGSGNAVNENTKNVIAYCFAPVDSYSSFGSYTGNGSTDGPFVYTGFAPKYLLVKSSTVAGAQWFIFDSARSTYNMRVNYLQAESSNAEGVATTSYDFCSNGFKLRASSIGLNGSGETYIYAAFAENPFSVARAR